MIDTTGGNINFLNFIGFFAGTGTKKIGVCNSAAAVFTREAVFQQFNLGWDVSSTNFLAIKTSVTGIFIYQGD